MVALQNSANAYKEKIEKCREKGEDPDPKDVEAFLGIICRGLSEEDKVKRRALVNDWIEVSKRETVSSE
jgi:hypothetical protein